MKTDLEYLTTGLFTSFFPNTRNGEEAWREIAKQTDGTGKIFTMHLKDTLKQLRKAGLVVKKCKKLNKKEELELIYKEMDELGIYTEDLLDN